MITNWDDAYANGAYIADGDTYPERWRVAAKAFRSSMQSLDRAQLDIAYGPQPRQVFDLFRPPSTPRGLVVFVHGGYWLAFDKSSWSHLARGAVDAGWAVAVPSYTLAPQASVSTITRDVAKAIEHAAAMIDGPIRLAGHSAGGQLVTRMVCANAPLSKLSQQRIAHVLSISGVYDLRPLQRTAMNEELFGDPGEAEAESPVLLKPTPGTTVTCWVGALERPEFLRQNDLLVNQWARLGAEIRCVHEPNRHHFNVIEGLTETGSPLTQAFLRHV